MLLNCTDREQFILDCQRIADEEARRIARTCRSISADDLRSEAMLHVIEHADALMVGGEEPGAYVRGAVRLTLSRYAFLNDSLVRTPRQRDKEKQKRTMPRQCVSLHRPVNDGSRELIDVVADDSQGLDGEYAELYEALGELPDLERRALVLRYTPVRNNVHSCCRVRDWCRVARELGVSERQAKVLVENALDCMRYEMMGRA